MPRAVGPGEHLVRLVLRAYPRDFQRDYGAEIARTVRDQRQALGNAGALAQLRFWGGTILDLLRWAMIERWADARLSREASGIARRRLAQGTGTLLLVFAGGNVVYDAAHPEVAMGRLALLVTGLSGLAGLRLLVRNTGRRRLA